MTSKTPSGQREEQVNTQLKTANGKKDDEIEIVSSVSFNSDMFKDVVSSLFEPDGHPRENTVELVKALGKIKKILRDSDDYDD